MGYRLLPVVGRNAGRIGVVLGLLASVAARTAAAQPQPRTAFEVATVKPSPPYSTITIQAIQAGRIKVGINVLGSRVDANFTSLSDLICAAYDVKAFQISGPDWLQSTRFDITAKLPEGAGKDDVGAALQSLLADRFDLVVHHAKQERAVFGLVPARGGAKLTPSDAELPAMPAPVMAANGQAVSLTQTANGTNATMSGGARGPVLSSTSATGTRMEALRITMPALAEMLSPMMERPVVDFTGIAGTYHVTLDISMPELLAIGARVSAAMGIAGPAASRGSAGGANAAPTAADPGGSSISQSLQQAGLRLEPRTARIDILVVDAVSRMPREE